MIATVRDHTFFARNLSPSSYVLDLGSNRGDFAVEVVRRYGVRCVAVEPTDDLAAAIPDDDERVRVRRVAVADRDGELELHVDENPESSNVFGIGSSAVRTETVPGRTLASLLAEEGIDEVALAKVDIEGAELGLLMETPDDVLRRIAQFTVEFHDFTGAMTAADIDRVVSRLRDLGFESIRFSAGHGNWLFFQPERVGVGPARVVLTRHVIRNVRGVAVRLRRRLRR